MSVRPTKLDLWLSKRSPFEWYDKTKPKVLAYMSAYYRQILVLLSVIAVVALSFIPLETKDRTTSILAAIAGLLLAWNVKESFDLKVISNKQLNETRRPFLKLELSPRRGSVFQVTNVGNGLARSVHLEPFAIVRDTVRTVGFKGIQSIAPSEGAINVELQNHHTDGESIKREILASIENDTLDNLTISYLDLADVLHEGRFRGRRDYHRGFESLDAQSRNGR